MKKLLFYFTLFAAGFCTPACHGSKDAQKSAATQPAPPWSTPAPKPEPKYPQVAQDATDVAWLDSERLMPVLELATKKKKPVFVVFYASWCAPCKVLEENILTQPEMYSFFNEHFLNFRTDYDSAAGRTIAEIYGVEKLPTVLFLNPNGVVLQQHTGAAGSALLRSLGEAALAGLTDHK